GNALGGCGDRVGGSVRGVAVGGVGAVLGAVAGRTPGTAVARALGSVVRRLGVRGGVGAGLLGLVARRGVLGSGVRPAVSAVVGAVVSAVGDRVAGADVGPALRADGLRLGVHREVGARPLGRVGCRRVLPSRVRPTAGRVGGRVAGLERTPSATVRGAVGPRLGGHGDVGARPLGRSAGGGVLGSGGRVAIRAIGGGGGTPAGGRSLGGSVASVERTLTAAVDPALGAGGLRLGIRRDVGAHPLGRAAHRGVLRGGVRPAVGAAVGAVFSAIGGRIAGAGPTLGARILRLGIRREVGGRPLGRSAGGGVLGSGGRPAIGTIGGGGGNPAGGRS